MWVGGGTGRTTSTVARTATTPLVPVSNVPGLPGVGVWSGDAFAGTVAATFVIDALMHMVPVCDTQGVALAGTGGGPRVHRLEGSVMTSGVRSSRVDGQAVSKTGEYIDPGVDVTGPDGGIPPYVVAKPASLWHPSPLQQTVGVYRPALGPGTVIGARVWGGPPVTRTPGSASPALPEGTMSIALVVFYTGGPEGVKWLAFRVSLLMCVCFFYVRWGDYGSAAFFSVQYSR